MTLICFIRHGRTAWNEEGRIQGHTDIPLSPRGRAEMAALTVPAALADARVVTSPLSRARETARLLGLTGATTDHRLMELGLGEWEGRIRADLAREDPETMRRSEREGRHFRPPGGETQVELQTRLAAWIEDQRGHGGTVIAVAHRGLILGALALATGWTMTGPPPAPLEWTAAHLFTAPPEGGFAVEQLNVPLVSR